MSVRDYMTVEELADAAGCSTKTVYRYIKKLMPDILTNGRETRLTEEQALMLMMALPRKHRVTDLGQPMTKLVQGRPRLATLSIEERVTHLERKIDILVDALTKIADVDKPVHVAHVSHEAAQQMSSCERLKIIVDPLLDAYSRRRG